ncbi:MAG: ABC transporter permease [Candidatus Kapabacteria bacterium]|jgi:lipoprotein-releasing system permease protein|nr:ABC transporter permease [Candidatus Kapabacteria bacterium]
MNIAFIRFLSKRFSLSGKRKRFLNFSRGVAYISVTLGVMALIVSLAVLDGFEKMLMDNAVKFISHNTVRRFDSKPFEIDPLLMKSIKSSGDFLKAIPIVERKGLIRAGRFVEGILMRASDDDAGLESIKDNIIEGKYGFDSADSKDVIIGKRLAKKLNVTVDDSIILYAVSAKDVGGMNFPEINKFRVSGIYETGMAEYDDINIYMPYGTALNFFKLPVDNYSKIEIILNDPSSADQYKQELQEELPYQYYVYSVFDIHSNLFSWIEIQKAPIPLVLGLISLVAVLNIVTILLITVVEKTSAIGILRAIGMNNKGIMSVFVLQGFTVGAAGTISGCLLGFILLFLQQTFNIITLKGEIYFLDSVPVDMSIWHFVVVGGISLFMSLGATIVPSYIAVKVNTISAIRYK